MVVFAGLEYNCEDPLYDGNDLYGGPGCREGMFLRERESVHILNRGSIGGVC